MESESVKKRKQSLSVALILFIWLVLGVAAFITSIKCFNAASSKGSDNLGGLVVAIFLGPLYWIYFALNKAYCRS